MNRTPAGVPTGGQFSESAKAEPDVSLIERPDLDASIAKARALRDEFVGEVDLDEGEPMDIYELFEKSTGRHYDGTEQDQIDILDIAAAYEEGPLENVANENAPAEEAWAPSFEPKTPEQERLRGLLMSPGLTGTSSQEQLAEQYAAFCPLGGDENNFDFGDDVETVGNVLRSDYRNQGIDVYCARQRDEYGDIDGYSLEVRLAAGYNLSRDYDLSDATSDPDAAGMASAVAIAETLTKQYEEAISFARTKGLIEEAS